MKTEQPCKLSHTVLYAKGWYKRSEDFWEDIKKCLVADDYSGDQFSKTDCCKLILTHFDKLPYKEYRQSLILFIEGISENNCWKYGYLTKNNAFYSKEESLKRPDYDLDEAIVRYCLSNFINLEKDEWVQIKPDFEKCLPAKNKKVIKKVEEFF